MKFFIAAISGLLFAINAYAQFNVLKPISDEEIARNTKHKIASITTTIEANGKQTASMQKFNTAGLLTYELGKGNTEVAHYTYDKKNRLVAIADSNYDAVFNKWFSNRQEFEYYDNGLLKERTLNGKTTQYSYDKKQNMLTEKLPAGIDDGSSVQYYYNDAFQLTKQVKTGSDGQTITVAYWYNNKKLLAKELVVSIYFEGYDSTESSYTYTADGKILASQTTQISTFPKLDDDGNPTGETERTFEVKKAAYTYNEKGMLKLVQFFGTEQEILRTEEYSITNDGATQNIHITDGPFIIIDESVDFNANGLKKKTARKENYNGKLKEITSSFTYTFF